MLKYKVIRPDDIVYVLLLRHKATNKYSFVNLTKEHICPCQFNTVEEALKDMDDQISKGKVISYIQVE